MEILQREKVTRTRFAGVREYRMVMDPRLFGDDTGQGSWPGMGDLVYLADAHLIAGGETGMHDHRDIDVITVVVEGSLRHTGSLGDGYTLAAGEVQVQRSGSEGFSHNESNPDDAENRLVQLWVLPRGEVAEPTYQTVNPDVTGVTRIYGADAATRPDAPSSTVIDLAMLRAEQSIDISVPCLAYLSRGKGFANEEMVTEGDLIRSEDLTFDAATDAQLIIVYLAG